MKGRKTGRKSGVFLALLALALCLLLQGCGRETREPQETASGEEDALQIGMSFDSFVIERWLRDRDFFVLTAQQYGAQVNVQVANGSAQEQISQIQYFIQKDMDVIVVIAVDGEALSEVIQEARGKGIRVISYDRLVMNTDTDLYISFDNEMVGTLMGEAMKEALPEGGNIFAIYGSPTDHNVDMVVRGFQEAIEDSGLTVVYSAYCDNWLAELAFDAVEKGLSSTPRNLAGVMCGNDDLAYQAFRALAENRLAGKVVLVGQDADLSACQRIVEGTQTMTVYKSVEQLAARAAQYAAAFGYQKMLEEGRIQEAEIPGELWEYLDGLAELDRIDCETGEVYEAGEGTKTTGSAPYCRLEPVAVTAENMDEVIIASDFHTEEDVYLNVKRAG